MTQILTLILLAALTLILRVLCKKSFTKIMVSIVGTLVLAVTSAVNAISSITMWRISATYGILFLMFGVLFICSALDYNKLLKAQMQEDDEEEEVPYDFPESIEPANEVSDTVIETPPDVPNF